MSCEKWFTFTQSRREAGFFSFSQFCWCEKFNKILLYGWNGHGQNADINTYHNTRTLFGQVKVDTGNTNNRMHLWTPSHNIEFLKHRYTTRKIPSLKLLFTCVHELSCQLTWNNYQDKVLLEYQQQRALKMHSVWGSVTTLSFQSSDVKQRKRMLTTGRFA